jgi:endonuclease/exonuclease/phosphatase family metal-dependent hydrolase
MQRLRPLTRLVAFAYPIALLLVILVLRFGAQRFWQAQLALYVPRVSFALPLLPLVIALLALRLRRELWSQLAAAWLVLFPLMGFVLPGLPRSAHDPSKVLRVLSYNGNFAYGGQQNLAAEVRRFDPDIAVFQQTYFTDQLIPALGPRYIASNTQGEFVIVSRFPITAQLTPPQIPHLGRLRNGRFLRYQLDTNLGPIAFYSVHPASPMYQIAEARRAGFRRLILSGQLFSPARRPSIDGDTELRAKQVRAFATMAKRETVPTIIAGDTNLPNLSPTLQELADFHDGFSEVGLGFGYTFPHGRRWMRIDRIFANDQLRFLDFQIGSSEASDHQCVFATLERSP